MCKTLIIETPLGVLLVWRLVTEEKPNNLNSDKMKTIEQLTGTNHLGTNLMCFVLLSTVIVLMVAFVVFTTIHGLKPF